MTATIRVVGTGDGSMFQSGLWLESVDLEHPGREPPDVTSDGIVFTGVWGGKVTLTVHRDRAQQFTDAGEALALWNSPSALRPFRPDGKPNKPLAAFSIELDTA